MEIKAIEIGFAVAVSAAGLLIARKDLISGRQLACSCSAWSLYGEEPQWLGWLRTNDRTSKARICIQELKAAEAEFSEDEI
jgi:hypothetical protein